MRQHFGGPRAHGQIDQSAVAVGAHDEQVKLAAVGEFGNRFARMAGLPTSLGVQAMAQQKLGHRRQGLLGFVRLEFLHNLLADQSTGRWKSKSLKVKARVDWAKERGIVRERLDWHRTQVRKAPDCRKPRRCP